MDSFDLDNHTIPSNSHNPSSTEEDKKSDEHTAVPADVNDSLMEKSVLSLYLSLSLSLCPNCMACVLYCTLTVLNDVMRHFSRLSHSLIECLKASQGAASKHPVKTAIVSQNTATAAAICHAGHQISYAISSLEDSLFDLAFKSQQPVQNNVHSAASVHGQEAGEGESDDGLSSSGY